MSENLLPGIELVNGDCAAVLPELPPADLILTSPPYDHLREYGGYSGAFDFDAIATACVANLAPGGVLVWVVGDQIVDSGENGTSFRQALAFMRLGLTLHQTLFAEHWSLSGMRRNAYYRDIEYMFALSKDPPATANLLDDRPAKWPGSPSKRKIAAGRNGDYQPNYTGTAGVIPDHIRRGSVWYYRTDMAAGINNGDLDCQTLAAHPAVFPPQLARDHILSWTNPGDLVIDPMVGNGTTLRAAADLSRRAIGIEINPEYCELIRRRLAQSVLPMEV